MLLICSAELLTMCADEYILRTPVQTGRGGKDEELLAPEPLLPNFGSGSIRRKFCSINLVPLLNPLMTSLQAYYQDINMMVLMNSKERTLDEFVSLG